jgi:hypothetical protein
VSPTIALSPLVPVPLLAVCAVVGLALSITVLVRRGRGGLWRLLALLGLILALLDPRIVREEREPLNDVALIVVDRSPSQRVGEREQETGAILDAVNAQLARFPDIDVRTIETVSSGADDDTRVFTAIEQAAAEESIRRLAAVVIVTDGQVHDVPDAADRLLHGAPVHALLTGAAGETDRRLSVERAPTYGLVGKTVDVLYRVDDLGVAAPAVEGAADGAGDGRVTVRLRLNGVELGSARARVGTMERLSVTLPHAGSNVVEIEAEPLPGEVSTANNVAAAVMNGVRERLKVLLVSGQPHAGERTWRNLLGSDPAVDLVHFTILRPPDKDDVTPIKELSLIIFPVQELFEEKLDDFDLVIFDRYVVRGVLPITYFSRIADYVEKGGAILFADGPEFAGPRSIYNTALSRIMPVRPTGRVIEQAFRPGRTASGRRHPVTAALAGGVAPETAAGEAPPAAAAEERWGRWFRLIDAEPVRGTVLMSGPDGRPLVVLDRVGDGRVAQLLSDHVWLWARGYDGGGPHAELLRRMVHWLMKEPELEEEALSAVVADKRLVIERRSLSADASDVTVTAPDGTSQQVAMEDGDDGIARAVVEAPAVGLYRITDGVHTAIAVKGTLNAPEMRDLRATAERLSPITHATGGGIAWAGAGLPEFRRVREGRDTAGHGWLGLRRNEAYHVRGVRDHPLLPGVVIVLVVLGGLLTAWWREGR